MKVEFGGPPKPIVVHGKEHFIHFTELPPGIRPGYINITNMEGGRLPSCPWLKENSDTLSFGGEDPSDASSKISQGYEPVLPVIGKYLFSANLGTHPYAVASLNTYWTSALAK
jgi:hypothetical protein